MIYHRSASYPQLEGLPKSIQEASGYRQVLRLLHGRPTADAGVFSEPAYYFWMKDLGLSPDDFGNVVMIEKGKRQWIFVRRGLSDARRDLLKRVVDEIYADELYDRMLVKYGKQ